MKKSHFEILKEIFEERKKYFENAEKFCKEIKKEAQKNLGEVKLYLFGSVAKGKWGPDSDIDVLVVSNDLPRDWEERRKLRTKLKSKFPFAPFQIHLATFEEFEQWYKKFIKEDLKEIR